MLIKLDSKEKPINNLSEVLVVDLPLEVDDEVDDEDDELETTIKELQITIITETIIEEITMETTGMELMIDFHICMGIVESIDHCIMMR